MSNRSKTKKTQDYYEILGVKRECTESEIKKAYRKLAMEYHPDKHMQDSLEDKKNSEDKFKEINKAYEILGDQQKRKRYDQFGDEEFSNARGYQFNNASDVFNSFFQSFGSDGFQFGGPGMSNGQRIHIKLGNQSRMPNGIPNGFSSGMFGGDMFGNSDEEVITKDKPVTVDLNLTLEELYNGCSKKMKISRTIYTGHTNKKENEIITIDVKSGWKAGTKITFNNKGDIHPNREPSDMIFIVKQKPHDVFTRDGNNLVTTLDITAKDIQTGIKREIVGIDGEKLSINIPKNIISDSNYVHKILKKGMPIRKEGKNIGRGDILIKFLIKFDKK
jgi:DnaJ homolog subfamily B member 4